MQKICVASYKGTGKLFNKVVRCLDRTLYSHTELGLIHVKGDIWRCASASFMDGGVRTKLIELTPDKWDVLEFKVSENGFIAIADFLNATAGAKYDTLGMLGAGFMIPKENKNKWFCNEWVGAALGIKEPHRFRPASFHIFMERLKLESAGLSFAR